MHFSQGKGLGDDIIRPIIGTPAIQELRSRVERGGVCSFAGVHPAAQPFLLRCLRELFPGKAIVAVTHGVKAQESFQQDLETWFGEGGTSLYYPAWEVLPHESRLPHADVIAERMHTLVELGRGGEGKTIVTNVTALLQKTFPAGALAGSTKVLRKGDRIDPLDLIEWLEDQGYEPEAQVTSK